MKKQSCLLNQNPILSRLVPRKKKGHVDGMEFLSLVGFGLIIVGVLVVILAVVLLFVRSIGKGKGKVRGGGVVVVGPVPIIFGTDEKSLKTAVLLSIALMVLVLIVIVVQYFLR